MKTQGDQTQMTAAQQRLMTALNGKQNDIELLMQ